MGYEVYGLARSFKGKPGDENLGFSHERFHPIGCDLTDAKERTWALEACLRAPGPLRVLVNNAGVGHFGGVDTLSEPKIAQMIDLNLLVPALAVSKMLPAIVESQGFVVNIASSAAFRPHRLGAVYAATKAGLVQYSRCLFEEVRKRNVKVAVISPDMTLTRFHDDAAFSPGSDPLCHLEPECVAEAIRCVLSQRTGTVLSELVLLPQMVGIDKKKPPKSSAP
jgi:short-subunit dehydrogenase